MYLKIILFIFSFLIFTSSLVCAQSFEVKHADTLEVINNLIKLNGNILVQYKDTFISAPEGNIESSMNGNPEKAVFSGGVKIILKDKKIESKKVIFNLNDKSIVADGNVISEIKDKDGTTIKIFADNQTIFTDGRDSTGKGNVKTLYKDTIVNSDEVILVYKNKSPDQAIYYGTNDLANITQPKTFTEAKSITFNLPTNEIQASGKVNSMIWANEDLEIEKQDPVNIYADDVFIEDKMKNIIARGSTELVMVYYQETIGESQKVTLIKNESTKNAEKIVFEGNAEVTQPDKQLISQEVIFNFKDKSLISNTKTNIRPKTIIFKKEKT